MISRPSLRVSREIARILSCHYSARGHAAGSHTRPTARTCGVMGGEFCQDFAILQANPCRALDMDLKGSIRVLNPTDFEPRF